MKKNTNKPIILVAFKEGGENGGPYVSHRRIIEWCKSEDYELVPFFFPRSRAVFSLKQIRKLISEIQAYNPAAMHIVGLQIEGFVSMVICKLARVKTILAVHGSAIEACGISRFERIIMQLLETYTIKNADVVYGVSDYVTQWKICKKARKMYGTIYNLAENTKKEIAQSTIREELGINSDDIVIVSTGRIIEDKGYDILLKVIESFKDEERVRFIIAGEGYYKKIIEKRIQELNINDRVYLLGYRVDIDNILDGSDIFILCTRHETLCISLQEAGAHGLPLIATDVGGVPEIIDETCGILIKNEDVDGFINAVNSLINDREKMVRYGINARKKIEMKFDNTKIINQLDELYKMFV